MTTADGAVWTCDGSRTQLVVIFITRLVIGNTMEVLVPALKTLYDQRLYLVRRKQPLYRVYYRVHTGCSLKLLISILRFLAFAYLRILVFRLFRVNRWSAVSPNDCGATRKEARFSTPRLPLSCPRRSWKAPCRRMTLSRTTWRCVRVE